MNNTIPSRRPVPPPRRWLMALCLVVVVASLWALLHRLDPGAVRVRVAMRQFATAVAARPAGAVLATIAYALAGIAFVPVTLLATTTLAVFGFWPGIAVAWTGGLVSAIASHALGRLLGPKAVAWLPARLEAKLRNMATRRPLGTALVMRLSPVGNFGAFNLMAGAVSLPRGPFILGNMLGLVPGLLGLGVLVDRAGAAIRHPTPVNILSTIAALGLLITLGVVLKRRLRPALPANEPVRPPLRP